MASDPQKISDHGMPFKSESPSLILSSKIIFSFRCESLIPEFDIDDMPYGYHPWRLKGKVQKLYKGRLDKEVGASFETDVTIYVGPVRSRPVGIWFGLDPSDLPASGESWVIFCSPKVESSNPGDFLHGQGEGCTAYRLKDVNADLDLTDKLFSAPLDLKSALTLAQENSRTAGPLFLNFFWEQFGEAMLKDPDIFEHYLSILEGPALSSSSRYTFINDLESFFSLRDGAPGLQKAEDRFAISLFRLLKQKESENSDFHRNALGTFIPNLLGIDSGLSKRSADQVFAQHPQDRREAATSLQASYYKEEAKVLLQWIQHGKSK